jgi:hypothetical protein
MDGIPWQERGFPITIPLVDKKDQGPTCAGDGHIQEVHILPHDTVGVARRERLMWITGVQIVVNHVI